jgi:glutamate/aspartate transport system substrate-binding protein
MNRFRPGLLARLGATVGFLSLVQAPAQADEALERIRQTNQIRIGYRAAAVPFSYIPARGAAPIGYVIDICEEAVQELRKVLQRPSLTVAYVAVDPKSRFTALNAGEIDMECANTTITRERRAMGFSFSLPYFITGSRVMTRTALPANDIKGLAGKTVVVIEGTTTASTVQSRSESASLGLKVLYAKKRVEGFALLDAGKADALVEDDTVLYALRSASRSPDEYKIIGGYLSLEPFAVMVQGSSTELRAVVNRVLRDMFRSSELEKLHARWFLRSIPPDNRVLAIPMSNVMRDFVRFPTEDTIAYP